MSKKLSSHCFPPQSKPIITKKKTDGNGDGLGKTNNSDCWSILEVGLMTALVYQILCKKCSLVPVLVIRNVSMEIYLHFVFKHSLVNRWCKAIYVNSYIYISNTFVKIAMCVRLDLGQEVSPGRFLRLLSSSSRLLKKTKDLCPYWR